MLSRVKDACLVLGATVLTLALANLVAWGLNHVHFQSAAHETFGLPGGPAPHRTRIARTEYRGVGVQVDADGWRAGRPGRMLDAYRPGMLFAFGGSALFGFSVTDEDTLTAQIQASGVPVFNFGQMGYQLHDEVMIFADLLRQGYVPAVAVFYDGANEFGRSVTGTMTLEVAQPYIRGDYSWPDVHRAVRFDEHWTVWDLLQRTALAELATRVRRRLWGLPALPEPEEAALTRHAHAAAGTYLQNVELAVRLGRAYSVKTVFILQPLAACLPDPAQYPYRYSVPPPPWQIRYYRVLYAEIMRRAAPGQVLNWCEAMNTLVAQQVHPFNTTLHLNRDGHRAVAARLTALLDKL